jgi:hypothetical protein
LSNFIEFYKIVRFFYNERILKRSSPPTRIINRGSAHGWAMVGGGGGSRRTAAACGRWCLVILAVASALGVSGPAFYWRY